MEITASALIQMFVYGIIFVELLVFIVNMVIDTKTTKKEIKSIDNFSELLNKDIEQDLQTLEKLANIIQRLTTLENKLGISAKDEKEENDG